MNTYRPLLLLVALAAPAGAADLAKVDRSLSKEPVYRSKKPLYAMAVFGPEAKHRVWLVLDGDTLYADRDGTGDLTRPGCAIRGKPVEGHAVFEIGAVEEGGRTHIGCKLTVVRLAKLPAEMRQNAHDDPAFKKLLADPDARLYMLSASVVLPGFRGTEADGRVVQTMAGHSSDARDPALVFQFADRPGKAPVVHFAGPWSIALYPPQRITLGEHHDLKLALVTPGIGPGTNVTTYYDGVVPDDAYPVVEIAFPAKEKGKEPIRRKWVLKERC